MDTTIDLLNIMNAVAGIIIIISSVSCIIVFRRLILYMLQKFRRMQNTSINCHFDEYFCRCLILTLALWGVMIFGNDKIKEITLVEFDYNQVIFWEIILSILIFAYEQNKGYDEIDLIKSQSDKLSIGATWAHGAFCSYFEVSFQDWSKKVKNYLASGKQLTSNALVLICPLSCNIEGTLSNRSENILHDGYLEETECDQGGNTNRSYKFPVYKVMDHEHDIYIIAQYPSSLGTLWETKDVMKNETWVYHRNCFIQTLRNLLKPYPCVILEYDDVSSSEPLDSFLLRKFKINKERKNYV